MKTAINWPGFKTETGRERMHNRRRFLKQTGAAAAALFLSLNSTCKRKTANLRLASFRFDVTPPPGHSCCGGWIKPVEAVDDSLEALGVVLLGAGKPIVLCVVDWTGLLNEAHVAWRKTLAEAAGTTPDRVAVHVVHQHNAPFACLQAERLAAEQGDLPHIIDVDFFQQCLKRGRRVVKESLKEAQPLTHIAHGQGRVQKVASNRRVDRDADGHVRAMRGSSCRNAERRALPEGLVDPWLRTVVFYNNNKKIASLHYYATHPMSYYGDGRVSSDFAGLARKRRQQEEPDCLHLYFTGCAGNVAAGKYNDGSPEMRPILTDRVYQGILSSEEKLQPRPLRRVAWETMEMLPPPRKSLSAEKLQQEIADSTASLVNRLRPAFELAWLHRVGKKIPIVLSALHLNDVTLLHLPAEPFVQYQLRAQQMAPRRFIATAGYGDGGPWYIPTAEEYANGGYEVSEAFCDPQVDEMMTEGIRKLLD